MDFMLHNPLVSVVCLCYNHEKYVREALLSVQNQTYEYIEILIIDDCSTDNSAEIIEQFIRNDANKPIKFHRNPQNLGNCKSFNKLFQLSRGDFIIDFATDDVMEPQRIERQIELLKNAGPAFGVAYSDAWLINENSEIIGYHTQKYRKQPSGNIFPQLVKKYFICPPTMCIRRQVLEELGGYDEQLAYEDFDFWVRSSKKFKYIFDSEKLTKRREIAHSLGKQFFARKSPVHESTLVVCKKIYALCENKEEFAALLYRITYEMYTHCKFINLDYVIQYGKLWMMCVYKYIIK